MDEKKDKYFWQLTNEKSNILAKMFELSVKKGYASKEFVENVMCNDKVEYLIDEDNVPDWSDGYFLIATFDMDCHFTKGETVAPEKMWFLGYLYKYWMRSHDMTAMEVYKILPYDRFMAMYNFYHTQGWEYVIQDATETYEKNGFVI